MHVLYQLMLVGLSGPQDGGRAPAFPAGGEESPQPSTVPHSSRSGQEGTRAGVEGQHAWDAGQGTLSSPLHLGLYGWRSDHLSSGPGALRVGCGGSGHQDREGTPVPGWPLNLTQAFCGQCRVPGLSLGIPFD